MRRGTRPDLYSRVPSSTALMQAMNPGPNRNVQSRTATRAWSDRRVRAGDVLAQRDHGQEADDAGHDDRGLEHPGHDQAERHGLVLPLDDRVQGHGGADAGHGVDEVEEARGQESVVVPWRDGEVGVHRVPDEDERGQGCGEGEQVEDAGGAGVVAGRVGCDAGGCGSCGGGHGLSPVWCSWGRVGCRAGFHLGDRDEGKAEVAEPLQQPVQGGLVHDRASEGGGAVGPRS